MQHRRASKITGPGAHGSRALVVVAIAVSLVASLPGYARAAELIIFERPDCPWCRRFDQEVAPGYALSAEGAHAPLRRIDIARAGEAGIVLAGPVRYTPTFVLVDDTREVGRITGYPGPDFFWALLAELLAKARPLDPPKPN